MSDLINREDAIAVVKQNCIEDGGFDYGKTAAINGLKRLPSTEPKHDGDSISRQDAISAVENTSVPFCTFGKSREYNALKRDAVYAIKALPSADITETEKCQKCQETTDRILANAKREWIPCSERLPNKEGSYLITSETGAVTTAHWYMPSEWKPDGFWGRTGKKKTVAWMPLPEPYKAESEDKE